MQWVSENQYFYLLKILIKFNKNLFFKEYLFTPTPSLTLRSIGGIFDFYFVVDNDPKSVIQTYHQVTSFFSISMHIFTLLISKKLIGLPVFPPYWSLGFQISRWGYDNLTHIKTVVDRTRANKIPHDVQYADIDYMIGYRDFTVKHFIQFISEFHFYILFLKRLTL